ncbi:MAG: AmpG family muropeptide MFS transporter [Bdellovibrionaceae bacterium]|nr:AmpG family muropeptide MFS transporter [Pseudobdellovibrionaceae bacterium]
MANHKSFLSLLGALKNKRMVVVLLLGFSSGLPIMLLYKSLKIWLRREGIDLSTIGYISWVTVPYSFNFLWAFFFDRFTLSKLGRRRGWLLLTQIGLTASLFAMGLFDPKVSLPLVVGIATILCFFSASQDVVIDAYRREILPDSELGVGASLGVYGYRVGMLVASGFGLWMVDANTLNLSFNQMFFVMGALMSVGILTTLFCDEPKVDSPAPSNLKEAVVDPFLEFFRRDGAVPILLFILLFKIGDSMVGAMLGSFYVDVGFTNADIAVVTSGLGFFSTMAGLFVGGALIYVLGYYVPMLIFGVLQALSTLSFIVLTYTGNNLTALSGVVFFEDFSSGMGTSALVAFMSSLTNKRFTATQYALFASLASFGRTFVSGFSGDLIEMMGYGNFFIFGAVIAVPGLLLLLKVQSLAKASATAA